jgi:hypothetical protein
MKIMKNTELENSNGLLKKTDKQTYGSVDKLKEVEGTPFSIYGKEDECVILLGNYRLTDELTKKECNEWINNITWNKLIQVIMVVKNLNINIEN